MKSPHTRPVHGLRPAERLPASSLAVIASSSPHLPQIYGPRREVRERDDRTSLEDKVRHTVESWTAEEKATAYWYLYACGMTLERAKAIRHKSGFGT